MPIPANVFTQPGGFFELFASRQEKIDQAMQDPKDDPVWGPLSFLGNEMKNTGYGGSAISQARFMPMWTLGPREPKVVQGPPGPQGPQGPRGPPGEGGGRTPVYGENGQPPIYISFNPHNVNTNNNGDGINFASPAATAVGHTKQKYDMEVGGTANAGGKEPYRDIGLEKVLGSYPIEINPATGASMGNQTSGFGGQAIGNNLDRGSVEAANDFANAFLSLYFGGESPARSPGEAAYKELIEKGARYFVDKKLVGTIDEGRTYAAKAISEVYGALLKEIETTSKR